VTCVSVSRRVETEEGEGSGRGDQRRIFFFFGIRKIKTEERGWAPGPDEEFNYFTKG
jgi:hypothetical protein